MFDKKAAFKASMQKVKKEKCRKRYDNDVLNQFMNMKKE